VFSQVVRQRANAVRDRVSEGIVKLIRTLAQTEADELLQHAKAQLQEAGLPQRQKQRHKAKKSAQLAAFSRAWR
jgi:hypothetical protein